jgi:hypothetical protein
MATLHILVFWMPPIHGGMTVIVWFSGFTRQFLIAA